MGTTEVIEHLKEALISLEALCGKFSRIGKDIRVLICNVRKYFVMITSRNMQSSFEISIAFEPFSKAYEGEPQGFQQIYLDTLYQCLKLSGTEVYFNKKFLIDIFTSIQNIEYKQAIIVHKVAKLCFETLKSLPGQINGHGPLLKIILQTYVNAYNSTTDANEKKYIEKKLTKFGEKVFADLNEPPVVGMCDNMEKFAEISTATLITNSQLLVNTYRKPMENREFNVSIRDHDIALFLYNLVDFSLRQNAVSEATTIFLLNTLVHFLRNDSKFYTRPPFKSKVKEIIPAFFYKTLSSKNDEMIPIAVDAFLLVFSKFAKTNQMTLYNAFKNIINPYLKDQKEEKLLKTLKILKRVSNVPQLFIYLFSKYDCDQSGKFEKVFETFMNLLFKLFYSKNLKVQKKSLKLVTNILVGEWKYFLDHGDEILAPITIPRGIVTHAIHIFNQNSKDGLKFLFKYKAAPGNPKELALFLIKIPILDRVQVGNILRNEAVLKHYIKYFDFKKVAFEYAFLEFFSTFEVFPGAIDMTIEEFANHFIRNNKKQNKETVVTLCKQILNKPSEAEFIAYCAHLKIPPDNLKTMYGILNKVNKKPTCIPRYSFYNSIKSFNETLSFIHYYSPILCGPMFASIWAPLLGALTNTFSDSQSTQIWRLCLRGLSFSLHFASNFYYHDILTAFINSFLAFIPTHPNNQNGLKSSDCADTLFASLVLNQYFIDNAWNIIFDFISTHHQSEYYREPINRLFNSVSNVDNAGIARIFGTLCDKILNDIMKSPNSVLLNKLIPIGDKIFERPNNVVLQLWAPLNKLTVKM